MTGAPPALPTTGAAPTAVAGNTSSSPSTTTTASIVDTASDVTPFVPIVLDLWRHLFLVHLGRCSLRHHVEGDDAPALADSLWVKNDYAILQWIYQRIFTELFHLVVRDGATGRDVWTALRDLFQDNCDARITQLHTELRTLAQGNNSASAYCQRVKAIGDELQELDTRVDDRGSSTPS